MNSIKTVENSQINSSDFLSDFSEKDKKWDYHRRNTQNFSAIYAKNDDFSKHAAALDSCSEFLLMQWTKPDGDGETKLKLKNAAFCHKRHCPVCGWRRSMRNTAKFFSALPNLKQKYPKHRWLFLTLTVKNCNLDDLRSTLTEMNKAWFKLIRTKAFPADGFIKAVEVTRGKDGTAHPHFHVMLMVKPSYFSHGYIAQKTWAEMWQKSLRVDYEPVIDIRVIKPKFEGQDLQAAIVETLKYGTKVEDGFQDENWLYGITKQLHKMRFLSTGGALAGLLSDEVSNKEMVETGNDDEKGELDEEQPKMTFAFNKNVMKYKRHLVN